MSYIAIIILAFLSLTFIYSKNQKSFYILIGLIAMVFLTRIIGFWSLLSSIIMFWPYISKFIHKKKFLSFSKKNLFKSSPINLSIDEAYEILELKKNATREEINKSYKRLILKNHPDHGGSAYFSKKLTQARDKLLKLM